MSLGDFPLGGAPLGDDGITNAAQSEASTIAALYFDPKTRTYPIDTDGRYIELHPVDAAVELALFIEFGKISGEVGQTLKEVPSPIGATTARDVDERVRRALKHLVDRKLVRIERIQNAAPNRHTLFAAVTYTNLQTGRERPVRVI